MLTLFLSCVLNRLDVHQSMADSYRQYVLSHFSYIFIFYFFGLVCIAYLLVDANCFIVVIVVAVGLGVNVANKYWQG